MYLLDVNGTTVRFNEDTYGIVVTVEGPLPAEMVHTIVSAMRDKLSELEKTSYQMVRLES